MGWTDAGRRKAAKKRKGKHLSRATKAKISKALRGKKHPHRGHAQSAATRAKISKALKNKGRAKSSLTVNDRILTSLRSRQPKRRFNFGLSKARRFSIHVRHHGTTNVQILQIRTGKLGKTNATEIQSRTRKFILGKPILSNRGVIHNRVYRRRRSKRGRVAKHVR